jgi:hypothetical protein
MLRIFNDKQEKIISDCVGLLCVARQGSDAKNDLQNVLMGICVRYNMYLKKQYITGVKTENYT